MMYLQHALQNMHCRSMQNMHCRTLQNTAEHQAGMYHNTSCLFKWPQGN